MRRYVLWFALSCVACTSAEEKERQRIAAMRELAQADSAAEADFVADSVALAASITVDTIADLVTGTANAVDDNGYEFRQATWKAVGKSRGVCLVDSARYLVLIRGDTLSCQWGPPQ